jgi:signal transduction histidine kinase
MKNIMFKSFITRYNNSFNKISSCFLILIAFSLGIPITNAQPGKASETNNYSDGTLKLMTLVKDASALIQTKGEAAFADFRIPGSPWRQNDTYIFILDPDGNMLVHAQPEMEGKNQLALKDINGKPIIRDMIEAVSSSSDIKEGWVHYQWPVPDGLLPRWKSSYVMLVKAPSAKNYIVGCGMYNDQMERGFVINMVKNAIDLIEEKGEASFSAFHDVKSQFIVKDAYIFAIDTLGVEVVNPGFPSLEGRNVMDLKDTQGKQLVREIFKMVRENKSGWVDYMWPKPGESISTQKSTYVGIAKFNGKRYVVGCGVYLASAPKVVDSSKKMTAPELRLLVNDAARIFEQKGENAFPEFRKKNTKWFQDDSYFFVWTMEGVRYFHAANPAGEGLNMKDVKDVNERQWGKMFLDVAHSSNGEGWVHYMYPEPGDLFPTWKSSFLKTVSFPSGKKYLIGCGIYNMKMDTSFIEDLVNRASQLIAEQGKAAFDLLRDKKGPYIFMDTYVFVDNLDGVELVNGAQPGIEGKNLMNERDVKGKYLEREIIDAANSKGSGWVDYYWYKPGENTPSKKITFIRKVKSGNETYIVGAGYYPDNNLNIENKTGY